MQAETWRLIIVSAVPLASVFLLYLQNRQSSEREFKDRANQWQLELSKFDRDESQESAAASDRRNQALYATFLRFAGVVESITTGLQLYGSRFPLEAEALNDLAEAYHGVLLSTDDQEIQSATTGVHEALNFLMSRAANTEDDLDKQVAAVRSELEGYLEACRSEPRW